MVNRIFFTIIGLIFMTFVYKQVKKDRLSEKESFFWIVGAIIMVILGAFPYSIDAIATKLNITYPPSLLFFIGIIFVLSLVFRLTLHITLLKEQSKELAQRNALLEKRISKIEKDAKKNE